MNSLNVKKRIMIIEDDCDMQELMCDFFDGNKYELALYPSITLALDSLESNSYKKLNTNKVPDLIITDIGTDVRLSQEGPLNQLNQLKRLIDRSFQVPVILMGTFGTERYYKKNLPEEISFFCLNRCHSLL